MTDYCAIPQADQRVHWPNMDHPDLPEPHLQGTVIDATMGEIYLRLIDQSVMFLQPALPTVLDRAFKVQPNRQFVITELFIATTGSLFISATGRVRIV